MPHDFNGREVKAGDIVMIPCRVETVYSEGEFCNVTLKTCRPMPGNGIHETFTLNTKQVDLSDID